MSSFRQWIPYLALVIGVLVVDTLCGAAEQFTGNWVGGFDDGKDYVFLSIHVESDNGKISGTYDKPLLFQHGRSLTHVVTDSASVRFEIPSELEPEVFSGELKDGIIDGQMTKGKIRRSFRLTHLATIKPEHYVGTYQIAEGHFVFIRPAVELGLGALQLIDFKTGRVGVLFPTTTNSFFVGPAVLVPYPIDATVTFDLDDEGAAIGFNWAGTERFSGRRSHLPREELSFKNGSVTLSGTLVLPTTPPPHPAMVCVPASTTAATREMFRHIAEFFAAHGIASFIYDKRGLGHSTGDWLQSRFEDLADDALAAVQLLKTRADINSNRIGLMGASQSGWVVALAASKSADVAFIISQSGPGVTVEKQELYRSEAWLRADGFSEDEIRDAMKFVRQRYQCARTGNGWEELDEVAREVEKKNWFVYAGGHAGKDHPFWRFFNLIRDYDPVPVLEKVTCPVLAMFGGKDTYLPAEKSARIWQAALEKAGNTNVTIVMFPAGDHSLIECKTGGPKEMARARRFVPEYFTTLRDWTLKQTQLQ